MISRRASVVLAVLVSLCAAAAPAAGLADDPAARAQAQAEQHLRGLIDALAHPDPREREQAEKDLITIGAEARPAVLEATQSEDPELASRARAVLMRLPWSVPADSPKARRLLAQYGTAVHERARIIRELAAAPPEVGVLLRLLAEEPEAEFRWLIAAHMEDLEDLELDRRMKEVTPDGENGPVLFLAARKAPRTDRARALDLYRRVIELESAASVPAINALFACYEELIQQEMADRDYPAAAEMLRRQSEIGTGSNLIHVSGMRLLALHAYLGPLPGYARDVRAFDDPSSRPTLADRVLSLYATLALAPPPPLIVWARACDTSGPEKGYYSGVFFFRHHMHAVAEGELAAFVARVSQASPDDAERGAPPFYAYDAMAAQAHEILSRLAGHRDDDVAAADHLRSAADLRRHVVDARGRRIVIAGLDDVWRTAELHWRELRAARSTGDQKKLREHLDALKTMAPLNSDIVLDVVPLLRETGQPEAARTMFDKAYKDLRALVDANPDDPEPMNNLAWLCSRSGERLPEALDLATKAITLDPDNAAYLDTAAEANFRAGNIDEAIRLETKGLQSRPDDKFMKEQLERFKAAKK